MIRRLLLYLSSADWTKRALTRFSFARRTALRFVAGETMDDAIQATRALEQHGLLATLDYLGESVLEEADTRAVVATYQALVERIQREGLKASVSLKLTHLGLDISEDLCKDNLRAILKAAQACNVHVTIDMESSAYTEKTLRIFRVMRDTFKFDNVGIVIQAYLRRSEQDMRELAAEGAHVRLCKGAYLEPPEVAFPKKDDVDASFVRLMRAFLNAPPPAYLCIATHDENMIAAAEAAFRDFEVPPERYEFQMLYGVRPARQRELAQSGYKVRIYVPFGEAWYPYFMRRLAERPANLWFFVRALVGR